MLHFGLDACQIKSWFAWQINTNGTRCQAVITCSLAWQKCKLTSKESQDGLQKGQLILQNLISNWVHHWKVACIHWSSISDTVADFIALTYPYIVMHTHYPSGRDIMTISQWDAFAIDNLNHCREEFIIQSWNPTDKLHYGCIIHCVMMVG